MAIIRGHGPKPGHFKGAIDGGNIWWIVPNYKTAKDNVWPWLKKACRNAWTQKNEVDMTIDLPGGGRISVKSSDNPDSLRGAGLDGAVMDEAAFQAERTWTEVIRPSLADKLGWAIFISTPNGFNWFYDLWKMAQHTEGWEAWQNPSTENPLMTIAELEAIRLQTPPEVFEQEYEAHFRKTEGTEFDPSYFGDWMWFDDWPDEALTGWRVCTLDASVEGGEKNDYSAIIMMAVDSTGLCWVNADLQHRDAMRSVDDLVTWSQSFRAHMAGIESVAFQKVLSVIFTEKFSRGGRLPIDVRPINSRQNKRERIRSGLTPLLAQKRFRFKRSPGCHLLIEQLKGFPATKNDDGPDALEMAVTLARHALEWGLESTESDVPERVYT